MRAASHCPPTGHAPTEVLTPDLYLQPHAGAEQQTHDIDAGKNMYLLRMHTDRKGKHPGKPEYELVPCLDLRTEARVLLNAEHERLKALPPAPAPVASPAAPMDPGGIPQPQAAAAAPKRPRGAAPVGKVWLDGAWVTRPRAQKAPTPVTATTLKVQPRGKLPIGRTLSAVAVTGVRAFRAHGRVTHAPSSQTLPTGAAPRGLLSDAALP